MVEKPFLERGLRPPTETNRNQVARRGVLPHGGGHHMQHTFQRAFRLGRLLALIGACALATGCGRPVDSSTSPQAGATSSVTPGGSGQFVSGQVTLALDKQRYAAGDTINVTISNGLPQTIWSEDHQTNCTVLTAEHLQNGAWQAVGDCRLMTPTRIVPVSANSDTTEHLAVPRVSSGSGWPSGTYRVTLTYTGGDEGTPIPAGTSGVAHSAEFAVG
jgi:hypothetical protein